MDTVEARPMQDESQTHVDTEQLEEFRDAAENDEYAEIDLGGGFHLITDWEGDGEFLPYIVGPAEIDVNRGLDKASERLALVAYSEGLEYDYTNSNENMAVYNPIGVELRE